MAGNKPVQTVQSARSAQSNCCRTSYHHSQLAIRASSALEWNLIKSNYNNFALVTNSSNFIIHMRQWLPGDAYVATANWVGTIGVPCVLCADTSSP